VPPDAGGLSASPDVLRDTAREWLGEPEAARQAGLAARRHALAHFGLHRFLDDWDRMFKEVI